MNPRTTGILFLVAAGLGAFVYFYVIRGEEGRQEAEAQAKRLFPGVESAEVDWVELTTTDGRHVRAERREQDWQLVEPLAFPGDAFALDGIVSAVAELESEAIYEDPGAADVYGLDDAATELRFALGEVEHVLRTGDKTPMGGNSYAAVVGEKPVYSVPTFRVNSLRKGLDDLRDKRILSFDPEGVRRVVATWPDGRVELVREEGSWRLVAPLEGAADQETVKDLLSNLSFLRASGFEDEPGADEDTGLDAPAFAVELEIAAEGEGEERARLALALALAIGAGIDDGDRLVRAGQRSLYRIAASRIDDFARDVVAYREKRLAKFGALEAQRLEIVFPEGSGRVSIAAAHEDGVWKAGPEPMAPQKISRLVEELSKLEADGILAERVGPDELRELALDPPNATLLVYGEGEGAEARLAEVRIGALRGSDGIVAQSAEDPRVFQLGIALSEHIPVSLEAFRNRFLVEEEAEAETAEGAEVVEDLALDELLSPADESP